MDTSLLVTGGVAGISAVADRLRECDFPVRATYLVKRVSEDASENWVLVCVVDPFKPGTAVDVIHAHVDLRRAGTLPWMDPWIRIEALPADHIEASRLLEHARLFGMPPLWIKDAYSRGLHIAEALVVEDWLKQPAKAAA